MGWLCGAAVAAIAAAGPAAAQSQARAIDIAAQPLAPALRELARQSGANILFRPEAVRGVEAPAVKGWLTVEQAARQLVAHTELTVATDSTGALIVGDTRADEVGQAAQVEEVIVTASKREQRAMDVPQSISVVSGERFRQEQSVRFTDYLNKIPGVTIVSFAQGNAQIVLRGLTTGSDQLSSTVGIYVDEAPYGASTIFTVGATNTPDFDPRDLDRVEVLRGPQGTLYGADSLGGVLKYVTTPPHLSRFEGRVQAGVVGVRHGGSGHDLNGMLNIPIVADSLALRVTAYGRVDPGYVDDPGRNLSDINESEVYGGRASLLWSPTPELSVRLSALGQNLKTENAAIEDIDYTTLQPIYGERQLQRLINTPIDAEYRLYSGTVDWDLGWAQLISATSYSTLHSDSIGDLTFNYGPPLSGAFGRPLGVALDQRIRQDKLTQEVRLQSPGGEVLEWRGGFYFTREHARTEQTLLPFTPATGEYFNPLTGQPGATTAVFHYRGPSRYTEYAAFADLTYHATERFEITVGGRYSANRQRFQQTQTGLILGGQDIDFQRTSKDDSWTYLINPKFELSETAMIYGRISSGYRPGGPNIGLPGGNGPSTFEPDTVTSYEVGTKFTAFDRRLSVDVAAFRVDWKDIQVTQQFNSFIYVVNGPKARSQGVEGSAVITPMPGLTLTLGGAYTDAELRADAPTSIGGFRGDRLPNVPQWSGSLDMAYQWDIGPFDAFVGASYRYQGERRAEFITTPVGPITNRATLPDYRTLDLRAGVSNDRWGLNLFAKNVTDERVILGISPLANPGSAADLATIPYTAGVLQPRTVGVSVSAKF